MKRINTRIPEEEGIEDTPEMTDIPDHQYDLAISRDSLHHWTDPKKVFLEIKRVLKPDGKIYIHDHRRDLIFFGKMIVTVFSVLIAGNMGKYWSSSIAASYTKEEIEKIMNEINYNDWLVNTDLMDLIIFKN